MPFPRKGTAQYEDVLAHQQRTGLSFAAAAAAVASHDEQQLLDHQKHQHHHKQHAFRGQSAAAASSSKKKGKMKTAHPATPRSVPVRVPSSSASSSKKKQRQATLARKQTQRHTASVRSRSITSYPESEQLAFVFTCLKEQAAIARLIKPDLHQAYEWQRITVPFVANRTAALEHVIQERDNEDAVMQLAHNFISLFVALQVNSDRDMANALAKAYPNEIGRDIATLSQLLVSVQSFGSLMRDLIKYAPVVFMQAVEVKLDWICKADELRKISESIRHAFHVYFEQFGHKEANAHTSEIFKYFESRREDVSELGHLGNIGSFDDDHEREREMRRLFPH